MAARNSLNDLADYLDNLSADLPLVISNASREIADKVAQQLIEETAVDVGAAMSNWIVTLDSPSASIREAYAPSPKGKMRKGVWTHTVDPITTFFANVGPAESEVHAVLETKQPGQDIFITNNEPYIAKLNDGSSTQHPAGFVDRALILARELASKIRVI